jgi:hypothetical protein
MDQIREDLELFADFLTAYYINHEVEASFLLEVDGEIYGNCAARASHCKSTSSCSFRVLARYFQRDERSRRFGR